MTPDKLQYSALEDLHVFLLYPGSGYCEQDAQDRHLPPPLIPCQLIVMYCVCC
jgi:hypothetical protein